MDTNADGLIDAADLHSALDRVGAAIDATDMDELIRASDIDGRGQIDYEEFIAAMLDSNKVARRRDAVRRSFEWLDSDGDGFITAEDLYKELARRPNHGGHRASVEMAREMLAEADNDGDGKVTFQDFQAMMAS
jgi:Ca2+-binding EF-hand superfamily protein